MAELVTQEVDSGVYLGAISALNTCLQGHHGGNCRRRASKGLLAGANIAKCLDTVSAFRKALVRLNESRGPLTEAIRQGFEEQIASVDQLASCPSIDFDAAFEMFELPEITSQNYADRLDQKLDLKNKNPNKMRSELRLWYAMRLSTSTLMKDRQRACELMVEAHLIDNCMQSPALVFKTVANLGGIEKIPREIQQVFETLQ